MDLFRIPAVASRSMLLGVCLAAAGCGDSADLPPEVEARARQREEAERRAIEEAEQRRRERPPAIAPSESLVDRTETNSTESPGGASRGDKQPNGKPPAADVPKSEDDTSAGDSARATADSSDSADRSGDAPPIEFAPIELPPPAPQPSPRQRASAEKWAQLKAGMTAAQVEELLGPPTRRAADLYLTYWYYGEGRDAGKVAFIASSQRIMAWDPPLD